MEAGPSASHTSTTDSKPMDTLQCWKARVEGMKAELMFTEEECRLLEETIRETKEQIRLQRESVKAEAAKIVQHLEVMYQKASLVEKRCEEQAAIKLEVEKAYQDALDQYDRLHDVVKLVKVKEGECDKRVDYERMLQQESVEWAEEEHRLRTRLSMLQAQQRESRQKQSEEIAAAENAVREAESRLHSDRMSRDPSLLTSAAGLVAAVSGPRQRSASRASSVQPANDSILTNKSARESRKRDLLGDLTNQ